MVLAREFSGGVFLEVGRDRCQSRWEGHANKLENGETGKGVV